jgi:hypothetical protein
MAAAMQAASLKPATVPASSWVVEIPSGLIIRIEIFSHPGQDIADGLEGLDRGRWGALLGIP